MQDITCQVGPDEREQVEKKNSPKAQRGTSDAWQHDRDGEASTGEFGERRGVCLLDLCVGQECPRSPAVSASFLLHLGTPRARGVSTRLRSLDVDSVARNGPFCLPPLLLIISTTAGAALQDGDAAPCGCGRGMAQCPRGIRSCAALPDAHPGAPPPLAVAAAKSAALSLPLPLPSPPVQARAHEAYLDRAVARELAHELTRKLVVANEATPTIHSVRVLERMMHRANLCRPLTRESTTCALIRALVLRRASPSHGVVWQFLVELEACTERINARSTVCHPEFDPIGPEPRAHKASSPPCRIVIAAI
jgi:hypothetical protein